jgi:hypothetical protein
VNSVDQLPWHPSRGPDSDAHGEQPGDELAERWQEVLQGMCERPIAPYADCCSASATHRVDLPSGAALLLCGHHARTSSLALRSCGAVVSDASGRPVAPVAVVRAG